MTDIFCLSYDFKAAKRFKAQFESFINHHRLISNYRMPFDGIIIFEANGSTEEISQTFQNFFDGYVSFFLAKAGGSSYSGLIPPDDADWLEAIRKKRRQQPEQPD